MKKERLTTSREIYDRILWNEKLNSRMFTIGFIDRVASSGIREKPFLEWNPEESEIPWHRIQYFKCQDIIVWDRDNRLDLFATHQLPSQAFTEETKTNSVSPVVSAKFNSLPVYFFRDGQWIPWKGVIKENSLESFRLVSYNVLSGLYEREVTQNTKRFPAVMELLEAQDATILALQEVTAAFWELLSTQRWTRSYFVSKPSYSQTQKEGVMLLSKFPFTLVEYRFSAQKRFLIGSWNINQKMLHLGNVHLTSNRATEAQKARREQLEAMHSYFQNLQGEKFLAGDFNMREEEKLPLVLQNDWVDLWKHIHPAKAGYTFDPKKNTLAAGMTLSGEPGRLDRIVWKSDQHWQPHGLELFGQEALEATETLLYPSDHFGLCATFSKTVQHTSVLEILRKKTPVYQSAIVLIPPKKYWPAIQQLREKYDSKVKRWMPHITLLYGFIPARFFRQAIPLLADIVKKQFSFSVTLQEYQTFVQRKSTTVYLHPVAHPVQSLENLQKSLQKLFPQCQEQSEKGGGYTPHLTVGQLDEAEGLDHWPVWKIMDFEAGQIALIAREDGQPFEVHYEIALGSGQVTAHRDPLLYAAENSSLSLTTTQKETRRMAFTFLEQACQEVLGHPVVLQALGSALLGTETQESDMDVLCLIPKQLSKEVFLRQVQEKLRGIAVRMQLATEAQVPVLRFEIEGVALDLLCANHTAFPTPLAAIQNYDLFDWDTTSWQALAGYLEACRIQEVVEKTVVDGELFRQLVKIIKHWARQRGILGNAWGYLGTFSWTVLAAHACQKLSPKRTITLESLTAHFFTFYAGYSWSEPVTLVKEGVPRTVSSRRDRLPVIRPMPPYANSARNITASTCHVIVQELERAARLATQSLYNPLVWQDLLLPVCFQKEDTLLKITIQHRQTVSVEDAKGWLKGTMVGLLIELEKQPVVLRPYPQFFETEKETCIVWGIRYEENACKDDVTRVCEGFIQQFEDARIAIFLS